MPASGAETVIGRQPGSMHKLSSCPKQTEAISKLDKALRFVAGASLALVLLVIILQVAMRYMLQAVPFFMEEAARYLCIWGVFAGIASAVFHGTHIRVAVLQHSLRRAGKSLGLLLEFTCLCLYLLVAIYGFKLALFLHAEKSIAMGLPLSVPVAAIPVFFTAAAIMSVANIRNYRTRP